MKRLLIVSLIFLPIAGSVSFLVSNLRHEVGYQQRSARFWVLDLASPDYEVQAKAEQALTSIGPDAIPELVNALSQRPTTLGQLRRNVVKRFFAQPPPSIDHAVLRQNAARQLAKQQDNDATQTTATAALVRALADEETVVRTEAQHGLRRLGQKSIPALIQGARHTSPAVRSGAIEVLAEAGTTNSEVLRVLIGACNDRDAKVRAAAIIGLGMTTSTQAEPLRLLRKALIDRSPGVRLAAAESLAKVKPGLAREDAIPLLEQSLMDPVAAVRIACARAHWLLSGSTSRALPVLVAALPDENAGWKVPFVLGEMGPKAADAVPALVEKLKHETVPRPLRSPPIAAQALGSIGLPSVSPLRELLRDPRAAVRTGAILALGLVGPPARKTVNDLIAALHDPELEVRQASVLSLANISPENKAIVPALKEMMRDDDVFLSSTAATVLQRSFPEEAQ